MRKLLRIFGEDKTRVSGNGSFPAPQQLDIGKELIVKRPCSTWDGFLGYFKEDKDKTVYAIYWSEVKND